MLSSVLVRLLVSAEVFGVSEAFGALVTWVSAGQCRLMRLLMFGAFACAVEESGARWIAAREAVVDSLDSFAFLRNGLEWADLVVFEAGDELVLV